MGGSLGSIHRVYSICNTQTIMARINNATIIKPISDIFIFPTPFLVRMSPPLIDGLA